MICTAIYFTTKTARSIVLRNIEAKAELVKTADTMPIRAGQGNPLLRMMGGQTYYEVTLYTGDRTQKVKDDIGNNCVDVQMNWIDREKNVFQNVEIQVNDFDIVFNAQSFLKCK